MRRRNLDRLKTVAALVRLAEERKRDALRAEMTALRAAAEAKLHARAARHSERAANEGPDISERLGNDLRWEAAILDQVASLRAREASIAVEHASQGRRAGRAIARDEVLDRMIAKMRPKRND